MTKLTLSQFTWEIGLLSLSFKRLRRQRLKKLQTYHIRNVVKVALAHLELGNDIAPMVAKSQCRSP
jgi:hypothetical protein